ncbi:hypothetical protein N7462_008963 [Penicillium macrosclerotiorum]|uniref:uncharacterized protein n=1 Tax=Penicillium macrosclerotiorum TaxID=303699 RepID=UPI002548DFB4|nr:uncharacterized protein N7462_008963 [Penicillium macrosclerotiorum]KAJ5676066.1 hypothetical protein N7462_008963 [Penicillium macrosclerotiorum]
MGRSQMDDLLANHGGLEQDEALLASNIVHSTQKIVMRSQTDGLNVSDQSFLVKLPEAPKSEETRTTDALQKDSEEGMQPLQSEADSSLQSLAVEAAQSHLVTVPAQADRSEHTPESQRPLLTLSIPKTMPKNTLVDYNGSPRIRIQSEIENDIGSSDLPSRPHAIGIAGSSSSEYDRDSDSDSLDDSPRTWSKYKRDMFMQYGISPEELTPGEKLKNPFKDCIRVDLSNVGQIGTIAPQEDTEDLPVQNHDQADLPLVSDNGSLISEKRIHAVDPEEASTVITSSSQYIIDEIRAKVGQIHRDPSRPKPMEASGAESCPMLEHGDSDPLEWITALQIAERSAHSVLLETNQHLSSDLAAEQNSIRQVLQILRQGCNHILDDLFRAQQVRMELYRQQMSSVKEQHSQICQELIRGLQELDHRVQQEP